MSDRRPNAWSRFRSAETRAVKKSMPDASAQEVLAEVSARWKKLSQEAKEEWKTKPIPEVAGDE